jgi:hypothetical protein
MKLYKEYLFIPKHGKIRDKVFSARIALSVCIILFLLSATGMTAYAYFSNTATVNVSTINAARYDLDYTVTKKSIVISPESGEGGDYSLGPGTYSVSLEPKGTGNAKTGFCIVTINDTDYLTSQINTDEKPFIFSLVVPDNTNIEVSFTAHWGMSSSYDFDSGINYIVNGGSLIVETSTEGFVSSDEDASSEQAITDQAKNTNTDSSTEKTNDSTIEEMPDKSDEQDTDADSSLDSSATDTTADQSSDAENDIDSSTDNSTTDTGDTEPTKDDPGH